MFCARFFAARFFAPRFWPEVGLDSAAGTLYFFHETADSTRVFALHVS